MIGISKLYLGQAEPSDALRYGRQSSKLPSHLLQFSSDKKPVVVWNVTRRCNLRCAHCYALATNRATPDELSTDEGKALINDLAAFGSPVMLFSGGEPLARPDLIELAKYAVDKGMRAVISTNGTLITEDVTARLKDVGLSYVGVSLDGLQPTNDRFRGVSGAFDAALRGIRACQKVGLKVGLRYTITQDNLADLPGIFDLIERENIPRACFYHLVYSGRGGEIVEGDLDHETARRTLDMIIDRTAEMANRGIYKEILTVDNHADGPYLYLRMVREGHPRADVVQELLRMNGGNSSGHGIGCVSWDGAVHPDQFWRHHSLGNVRERPFSEIWTDLSNPLLASLKEKQRYVTGRCVQCRFLDVCGGNLRARGEASTGDVWGVDPACYLTDEEIRRG
jgi:12,18-didecarboxysiroheme deacetylase